MQKTLLLMLGAILLTGAGCSVQRLNLNSEATIAQDLPKGLTLFVGQGCPRCEIVESHLKTNYKNTLVETKEVFNDGENAALLIKVIKECGLAIDKSGVPLLWDGQQCHEGDDQILKYLDNRMEPITNEPR
ncbi:MAG: hypothetical protein WC766_03165 [Patescibacteria group bacterium]